MSETRVVTIGDATLYNGDCLEIISSLTGVTGVCVDPPYGIEDIVGGYGRSGETIENDRTLDACMSALQLCCGIAPTAVFAVFYSPRIRREFMDRLPPALHDLGEIIWDKKAPGMGRGIRYQHETIAMLYTVGANSAPDWVPKLHGDMFSVMRDYRSAETHPHQKPISLITSLCESIPGNVILDPFMGSGTTGVACLSIGKKFIGIELDPKHFETSCRRIQEAHDRPRLAFAAEEPEVDFFGAPANDNSTKGRAA